MHPKWRVLLGFQQRDFEGFFSTPWCGSLLRSSFNRYSIGRHLPARLRSRRTFHSTASAASCGTPPTGLRSSDAATSAEFERELIRARTGEVSGKDRGVRFGRPRKLTPHQREEALRRLAGGETQADVARTHNVNPTTIGLLQ